MSYFPENFPLERFDEIQQHPNNFRLLERVPFTRPDYLVTLPIKLADAKEGERIHQIVILDTETTGLNHGQDKIIELGMIRATYSFDRRIILSIDSCYDQFEDPQMEISEQITQITSITQDMVNGKSLADDEVATMMANRPLVIAHNAAFDRPFFDERFPSLQNLSWACSMSIPWHDLGDSVKKLEALNNTRGYFYDAHRAFEDCLALLWLLHIEPQAFAMILDQALSTEYQVVVGGRCFDIKEKLKAMGYRFNGYDKTWFIKTRNEEEANRQLNLLAQVYDPNFITIKSSHATDRYKL